ncbi:MAG: hypothetical protein ACRDRV_22055 [Pseudonocardiaceae bacterium]
MSVVVLDTDVASALLPKRTPEATAHHLAGHIPAVTFVTIGELTKWTLVRQVAVRWGELQAYAQLRGRPRPVNDSWIAACCPVRDLPLATFNIKDFTDFAEHEGLEILPTQ